MTVLMLDVDGVLVREPLGPAVAKDPALDAVIAGVRGDMTAEDWQLLATGRADLAERTAMALARLGVQMQAGELIDYWFVSETEIDDAVLESVRRLRSGGMRVYLATNQEHLRARHLMETMGLHSHVDGMLYSASLGHRKPAPEYFGAAASAAGVEPADIVFVDDNAGNVDAARLAGWRATHWLGDMSLEAAISLAR